MSQPDQTIRKGLAGVVADTTAVSRVMPETNSLTYRGYAVEDLAENASFLEVAYLLFNGELPSEEELAEFEREERSLRQPDQRVLDAVASLPTDCHPMDVLRTAVSIIGTLDPEHFTTDVEHIRRAGLKLFAQLPTVTAFDIRRRRGAEFIAPDPEKSYSENFLSMVFGDGEGSPVNSEVDKKAFDTSLILYAEHSFNASTFTARLISSTLSDTYAAIAGAIGALKGPLHGGANEFVMHTMLEIDDPARAADWMAEALDAKKKVMGFGHRVYKNGDSRVPTMEAQFRKLAEEHDGGRWVEIYDTMAKVMDERTGIKPNLDFPAGPAYYLIGFDVEFYTPLFVMARVTGWIAHVVEQFSDNALIRPLSAYDGPEQREVPRTT